MNTPSKILLIEDDDRLRRILQLVLLDSDYIVQTAANGHEGISLWQSWQPDVVLTDLKMEPGDGLAVLEFGQKHNARLPVILLTAFGTVETAVTAMKNGAFDYLIKPIDNRDLLAVVRQALHSRQQAGNGLGELIGTSAVMQRAKEKIELFASTNSSVLISGASGTGKEVAARAIHRLSTHADGPFVRVNCAAIPRTLLESELFGHKKGAFTDAVTERVGAFIQADGGTLFLDEIGDLPLDLQPKLLHAVEEKVITPVGAQNGQKVVVKIVSATNRNINRMLEQKTFRQDLFYRLNSVHLHMPEVRERTEDLKLFFGHYIQFFSRRFKKEAPQLTPEALALLHGYHWPGNVREIKNVMERAVLTCKGKDIDPALLPACIRRPPRQDVSGQTPLVTDLHRQEEQLITAVLTECSWNQSEAARRLGISRNTLRYRIKKHGIVRDE